MNTFQFPNDVKLELDNKNVWIIFSDTIEVPLKQISKTFKKFLNDNEIGFISYRPESFFISQSTYNKIKG